MRALAQCSSLVQQHRQSSLTVAMHGASIAQWLQAQTGRMCMQLPKGVAAAEQEWVVAAAE